MTLDAAEKAGVPVVRGLVWRPVSDRVDEADTPIGEYQIAYYIEVGEGSGWSAVFRDNEEIGDYPTSSIAMSACQADYERRGREILNPDFLSALDTARAEIERLRERLRDATDERDNLSTIVATEIDDVAGAELDDMERRALTAESALTAAQARIAELEAASWHILPYLKWTISDESCGHHPTMPSAVAAFEATLSPVKENDRG